MTRTLRGKHGWAAWGTGHQRVFTLAQRGGELAQDDMGGHGLAEGRGVHLPPPLAGPTVVGPAPRGEDRPCAVPCVPRQGPAGRHGAPQRGQEHAF